MKKNTHQGSGDERINALKDNYEKRLKSLQENIQKIARQIDTDELVGTMKNDSTSKSFVGQRVKEIIEEGVMQEREKHIQSLVSDLSYAQAELKQIKEANSQLSTDRVQQAETLEQQIKEFQAKLEKERKQRDAITIERDRLKKEVMQLNIALEQSNQQVGIKTEQERAKLAKDYDALRDELEAVKQRSINSDALIKSIRVDYDEKLKELDDALNQNNKLHNALSEVSNEKDTIYNELILLQDQMKDLQSISQEASQRLKSLGEEKKKLEDNLNKTESEKASIIEKFNAYGEQLQKSHNDAIDEVSQKQQVKIDRLKEKIKALTDENAFKNEEIEKVKSSMTDTKIEYEKAITQLHGDLSKVKSEWEKKCKEIELDSQKALAEEQARNTFQINHLQDEFTKAMETKLKEVQNDAQQQITRTKQEGNEIKAMLDTKLAQIDKSYVSISKHEQLLDENAKKLREKFRHEMETMKEEFEKTMSIRMATVEAQRKKEQEILKASYDSSIAAMQKSLDDNKSNYNNLYSKYQQAIQERDGLEQKASNIESELTSYKLAQEAMVDKDVRLLQEEKLKSESLEAEVKSLQESLNDMQQKYLQTQQSLSNYNTTQLVVKGDNEEITNKLKSEQAKVRQLTRQVEELKGSCAIAEKEKKASSDNYKKKVMESDAEISSLQSSLANIRQKDYAELQKEIQRHSEEMAKFVGIDSKCESLQNKLKDAMQNYEEATKSNEVQQQTITQLKTKVYSFETQVAQYKSDIFDQSKAITKYRRVIAELHKKAKVIMSRHINGMHEYVQQALGDMKRMINLGRKECLSIVEAIITQYKERENSMVSKYHQSIQQEKEKLHNEINNHIKRKEQDILTKSVNDVSKLDEVVKNKNKELQEYQKQFSEEQKKCLELTKQMSEITLVVKQREDECSASQGEIEALKENNKKLNQKLTMLQNKYNEESSQHKLDEDATKGLKELEKKRRVDIQEIQKSVNDLRINSINEYRVLLSDIQIQQTHHKQEIDQVLQEYEKAISQYENTLNMEKEKTEHFKAKAAQMEEELANTQIEWQQEKGNIENKLKAVSVSMIQENEKCKRIQMNSDEEIEQLREQLREQKDQLEAANNLLNKYKTDISKQETNLKEWKKKLSSNDDANKTKIEELTYIINKREKENEELRAILSKSYQTLNSSVDKIKLASKMNNDTEELAKKIKDSQYNYRKKDSPSDYTPSGDERQKKSPLSISQLKSTPGKILKM